MEKNKFGFLKNHFHYEQFELSSTNEFYVVISNFYKDLGFDWKIQVP